MRWKWSKCHECHNPFILDKCVHGEIFSNNLVFVRFVQHWLIIDYATTFESFYLYRVFAFTLQINREESEQFLDEFAQCGWNVPTTEQLSLTPHYRFAAFQLKNMKMNVNHIKCVTFAIGSALFASELAKDWLIFHIQLIRSASTIIACNKLGKYAKYM